MYYVPTDNVHEEVAVIGDGVGVVGGGSAPHQTGEPA